MPAFVRVDFRDKLACQSSPTYLGSLYPQDLASCGDVLAIDEQESFSFSFGRVDKLGVVRPLATSLVAGLVASVVWSDNSFDEWRIATVETRRGSNDGGVVSVTANALIFDLADAADSTTGKGLVSTLANGTRVFSFTTDPITLDSLCDTYIIPACPSWVTKGTIDSTTVIPVLSWDRSTPQAVGVLGRDAIRSTGETCEMRLRRNGTTDYKLDFVAQIGSSATVPLFHPRTSLQAIRRRYDASEQGTRVFVKGNTDPSGLPGRLGAARWKVQSVVGTAVTLVDRNGGASPIAFDNQFASGGSLFRCKTNRTFAITSSSASAGSVTCSGGVSTLAADEDVEFRLTEPLTNTLRVGAQDGAYHVRPYVITGVASNVFTLTDNFGNLVADPVQVTDEHVDWYARRMTLIRTTTANGNFSGGVLTNVTSTVGVNAGDIVFLQLGLVGAAPYGFALNNGALVVDSTTVNTITVHARDDAALGTFAATAVTIRIYRPVATLQRITAANAGSNTITVDVAGTAANTDVIEFVQVDGAGEIPSYIEHPTYVQAYPTGYGVKVKDLLASRAFGVTQLLPNGWMRAWTSSGSPPDGWSQSGSGTFSRDTTTTRYGGYAYKWISAAGAQGLITSPVFYPPQGSGTNQVSVRASFYFSTYSVGGGANFVSTLTVYSATAAGAVGTSLGTWSIQPTDASGSATKVPSGQWVEIAIKGITLNTGTAPYGLIAEFDPGHNAGGGNSTGYLDAIECYPFAECPNSAVEFGDATVLHQSGNQFLTDKATPIPFYEFSVVDLERMDPVMWSRNAITIGGSVRAYEPEIPIDATVRLVRYERNHLRPSQSTVTLANRPTLLTDVISAGAAQQTRIVTVIQQSQA